MSELDPKTLKAAANVVLGHLAGMTGLDGMLRAIAHEMSEPNLIIDAPKDRAIWAWEHAHGHEAKVIWHQGEWECLSMDGHLMGVGFYPTHWRHSDVASRANLTPIILSLLPNPPH